MKKLMVGSLVAAMAISAFAADDIESLKQEIAALKKQVSEIKKNTGGDNLKWDVDFRTAYDIVNYETARGMSYSNDILSTRLWLGMKYAPTNKLSFIGQLAYNKAFGANPPSASGMPQRGYGYDTFDWVINENLTDNSIKVRQAYWIYFGEVGSMPYTVSVGRRPSVNGFLGNLREDDHQASPLAHTINVEFDGASILADLEKVTSVPGMSFKLCLGRGLTNARARFDMGDGQGGSYGDYTDDPNTLKTIDMAGFIFTPFDNGQYKVMMQVYRGFNVPGFAMAAGDYNSSTTVGYNSSNTGFAFGSAGMIATAVPVWSPTGQLQGMSITTNAAPQMKTLGDMDGVTISGMINGIVDDPDSFLGKIKLFASYAMTKTHPENSMSATNLIALNQFMGYTMPQIGKALNVSGINGTETSLTDTQKEQIFEAMRNALAGQPGRTGLLGSGESETGHSIWLGAQMPAMVTSDGVIGVEYNRGSKYWRPFTYGEDSLIGSKLATRGNAYEVYYTQPLTKGLSLQVRYTMIDNEYTGSQMFFGDEGMPIKIEDALAMGMNAVDKSSDLRAYLRYRY